MRLKSIITNLITLILVEVISRKTTSYMRRRLGL